MAFSEQFTEVLEQLDFKHNGAGTTGLHFISDLTKKKLSPKEIFGLETAKTFKADAVYFRKFDDNRPPIAQIYIYDNTRQRLNNKDYAEIQRALWSSCVVPLFLIIEKSQVLIFDSRKPVDIFFDEITPDPIETIQISSQALKAYSAKLFDNGTFWEIKKSSNNFLDSTSAYSLLIEGLKKIRKNFITTTNLPSKTAHKLLVLSILVKYLEERGDDGETLFAKNFFTQFGADDFCGVLRRKGQIVKLFAELGEHFNGQIFAWNDPEEVELLKKSDLSTLANFLDANNEGNQYVLWRLYSFNHLPVELISSVYEEFLGNEKSDVVYTPQFLVSMLIDEVMPIHDPKDNFKLIDVSCGSGIFLVAGYKRLIEWWRYKKYIETGELPPRPNLRTLKHLLKTSIFGIDVEEDATRLSIFSLALALCDLLSPKQIWTELKFDDLSAGNIITDNFFNYLGNNQVKFDLVVGNPPFIELTREAMKQLIGRYQLVLHTKIPQNQLALLFLDQAMSLLKPGGLLCLIMPSGPLLYNATIDFRKYFFEKYYVEQILDFTNLSSTLFGASVATSSVFVYNQKPILDESINHITIRRTKSSKEKIFFEIDHYDFHTVTYEEALNDRYVWKANLFGGTRIAQLIKRLSELRSLGEFLEEKKTTSDWDYGQGYIVGEKNRKFEADYITNKPTIIDKFFTEEGIGKTELQTATLFKDKSKESIFRPPHLLIKKSIGVTNIPVAFSNKYLTFRNEVIGITAPRKDEAELKEIKDFLVKYSPIVRFFISTTSSRAGISRSAFTLLYEDIMNLPYPKDESELKLSFAEQILVHDVLKYSLDQMAKGENAQVNNFVTERQLRQYGSVFCKSLNSVYEDGNHKFRFHSIIESDVFYAAVFVYTSREIDDMKRISSRKAESDITDLVHTQMKKNLRINRVIRLYQKDKILFVKPKQLRYWLKSIALTDADQTFGDLIKAGY